MSRNRRWRAACMLAALASGLVVALPTGPVQATSPDSGNPTSEARPAADPDGDGIKDPHDNCGDTANADQADLDGDGTGNLCDPDWEEIGDATVLAVVDYHPFSPYVWDLDARHMPQATDADANNDLPLDRHPAEWLPGYADMPGTTVHEVDLTLSNELKRKEWPKDASGTPREDLVTREQLTKKDQERVWQQGRPKEERFIQESDSQTVNLYWFKDTKILGAAEFGDLAHDVAPYERSGLNRTTVDPAQELGEGHGVGTTSVSVGNLHGMCPECLLVFLEVDVNGVDPGDTQPTDYAGVEDALEWAYAQPWIDAVVMQGAPSAVSGSRERAYSGSDIGKQVAAAEAGKAFFVSSGNGLDFLSRVPSSTLLSSLQGPDWAVTVGGTDTSLKRDNSPTGFGKPVDVSGTSSIYRSAYMSRTVGGTAAAFRATSNAVSVVSGTYVKALHEVRHGLPGPSRRMGGGVIAAGPPGCGTERPDCELADGLLTAAELRARLLLGAVPTAPGSVPGSRFAHPAGDTTLVVPAYVEEEDFAVEGHGTYSGRCENPLPTTTDRSPAPSLPVHTAGQGTSCNLRPIDLENGELSNVLGPLRGTKAALGRRAGEAEWFQVDSYCRQAIWGLWEDGLFHEKKRRRPPADAEDALFPVRNAYEAVCPHFAELYPDRVPDALKPYPPTRQ